tara:strand:+ start:11036 stop:12871 length:1836 start_codon:yes stop_codon:yes gene_type:complete
MSIDLHTLPWLVNNKNEKTSKEKNISKNLMDLASQFMDANQLLSFYEKIKKIDKRNLAKLSCVRILLLSNKTTDFINKSITSSGIRNGLFIKIKQINYSQVSEIIFKKKIADFDYIFLMFDYEMFNLQNQGVSALSAYNYSIEFIEKIKAIYNSNIIITTLVCPNKKIIGNYDYNLKDSLQYKIDHFNRKIKKKSQQYLIFDVSDLASSLGISEWFDNRLLKFFQSPFSHKFIPVFAEYFCKIILANMGLSKKVLVTDLDNTIWGGIVGECGSKNLKICIGDPLGEVYREIQHYLLNLKKMGVVLAICSKNNFKNAIFPFRYNKEMILKETDISVFIANWEDKYKNLQSISKQLNLPLNSFVFFDDSKFERDMIRNHLPDVAVCELPEDPTYFAETLSSGRFFESNFLSKEDKKRTLTYRSEIKRNQQMTKFRNQNEYLESLKMILIFDFIDDTNIERATQLFNKTNQFNLTAKKVSREELEKKTRSNDYFCFVVRLKDKFGDSGIISTMTIKKEKESCFVENWVMSCRVFGRKVEYKIFEEVRLFLIKKEIKEITGYFVDSKKNSYVKYLYKNLAFSKKLNNKKEFLWVLKNIKNIKKENYPLETKLNLK